MRLVSLTLLLRLKAMEWRCTGDGWHIEGGVNMLLLGLCGGSLLLLLLCSGYCGSFDVRKDLGWVGLFAVKVIEKRRSVFGLIRIGVMLCNKWCKYLVIIINMYCYKKNKILTLHRRVLRIAVDHHRTEIRLQLNHRSTIRHQCATVLVRNHRSAIDEVAVFAGHQCARILGELFDRTWVEQLVLVVIVL